MALQGLVWVTPGASAGYGCERLRRDAAQVLLSQRDGLLPGSPLGTAGALGWTRTDLEHPSLPTEIPEEP